MKTYNKQTFEASANGHAYNFYAHTTNTRNGFCHTVQTFRDYRLAATDTKISYFNRTWERFDYETCLSRAIEKAPKEDREQLRAILIERKAQKEHERAEAFVAAFSNDWNALSEDNKERLRNTVGTVETSQQAEAVAALTKFALMLQK